MACLPDLNVLYGHLYNRLKKATDPENPKEFDLKDYMRTIQKLVEQANPEEPDLGLANVQAVPKMFGMIMFANKAIRDKFKAKYSYDDLEALSDDFNAPGTGLEAVREYIAEEEISLEDIKKKLNALKQKANAIELLDADAQFLLFSGNTQKPTTVLATTGQSAKPVDPRFASKSEKNVIDDDKILFGEMNNSLISIIENKGIVDTVEYKGKKIYLRPMLITNALAEKYFVPADLNSHYKSQVKDGIAAFLSDDEGNMLFFDENGDFTTEDTGRPIYNYLRRIERKGINSYTVSGYTGIEYTLAKPEDILKSRLDAAEKNGITYTEKKKQDLLKQITENQKEEVVKLYELRTQVVADPKKVVLLPIIGGSYGIVNTTWIPFEDTDIVEDEIKDYVIELVGDGKGRARFVINRENALTGVPGRHEVLMQRGNIDEQTAAKIADVLTSDAPIKGQKRSLTAKEKETFAKVFLSNAIEDNRIIVTVDDSLGVDELNVFIKGALIDLSNPKSRDLIYDHLMKAVEFVGRSKTTIYSARVSYNNDYTKKNYTDYTLEDGAIVAKSRNYFDTVKKFIQVEYSRESLPAVKNFNSYLKFSIPDEAISTEIEDVKTKKTKTVASTFQEGNIEFVVSKSDSYKTVTRDLVDSSDATVSLAFNFDTTTETALKNLAEDEYFGVPLGLTKGKLTISNDRLQKLIIDKLNASGAQDIFFTGNDITDLVKNKVNQKEIDDFVYDMMDRIINSGKLNQFIRTIYTSGQTGVSEAFVKAGAKLNFPVKVITTSNFSHRIVDNTKKKAKFQDVKNKDKFLSRFGIKPPAKQTKATTKPATKQNNKATGTPKGEVDIDAKDIFDNSDFDNLNDTLFRSKDLGQDYNLSEAEEKEIIDWYNSSEISKLRPLNIVMGIVNSPAFADFNRSGINLYKGDGGTALDIYHEAWHVFSQLFLSKEEKTALYNEVARESNNPRWKPGTKLSKEEIYFEIEEALAEGFRDYKSGKYVPKGKVTKSIFRKILDFILSFFRGTTQAETGMHVADIANVKMYYDKLYKSGDKNVSAEERADVLGRYSPSTKNSFFYKLNRDKTIKPVADEEGKTPSPEFGEFTIDESKLISSTLDNMLGLYFQKQANDLENTTSGFEQIKTMDARFEIYGKLQQAVTKLRDAQQARLDKVLELNEGPKKNMFLQQDLEYKVNLLQRVLDNFGDIQESLDKKEKTGVIAYHLANTRFAILREKYVEIEDETSITGSTVFKDNTGVNDTDPKSILTTDTMMLLGSIFKVQKDPETGEAKRVLNELGIQELENPDIIWSKLARTLESSMAPKDMYNTLIKFSANYPEFDQLLNLLPSAKESITDAEMDMETRFWQDLKKPRVEHYQLNLNQEKDPEAATEERDPSGKYKAAVVNSATDVYSVVREWNNNFINATVSTNPYVQVSGNKNSLNTGKILKDFGLNGKLNKNKALEFLAALGIVLDGDSAEIQLIMDNPFFVNEYGLDMMWESIKLVNMALNAKEKSKVDAAITFKEDPITYLSEGLPKAIVGSENPLDVKFKIRMLATLQNKFSNNYSNFSLYNPEMNRIFEHFLDSTVTRNMLAVNKAENWSQLTENDADPNGDFKHMRWLAFRNNPATKYSVILKSIFNLSTDDPLEFGKKREFGNKKNFVRLFNDTGTQVTNIRNFSEGNATSSADVNSKFLQEMHTMLLKGIQEFMRHASKSTSMGMQADVIDTYDGKTDDYLYVGVKEFQPSSMGYGEDMAANILIGYISAELERIQRFKANVNNKNITGAEKMSHWTGYSRKVRKKDGSVVMAGEVFTAFDDVLSEETKEKLYKIKGSLVDFLESDTRETLDLGEAIRGDIKKYFNGQVDKNLSRLQEARYVDQRLFEKVAQRNLSPTDIDKTLVKAYTYNSWIHNFETAILGYGDFAQYNHEKEEFHKRNAGLAGGGLGVRSDKAAQIFVNDDAKFPKLFTEANAKKGYKKKQYDGTFNTAVIREKETNSLMHDEYKKVLKEDLLERLKKNKTLTDAQKEKYAEELSTKEAKEYLGMKEGDGQGYINFEAYRTMRKLAGRWFSEHEQLYRDIVAGKKVKAADIVRFFPSEKMQYFGNIQTTAGLPLISFHKFSLAPLIPGVVDNSKLAKMQDMMLQQGVDYVLFESGSKVGHITSDGEADQFLNEDGTVNEALKFTPNVIFAENLKNVTAINDEYKGSSIFPTQLRKLVLEGLYDQGIIDKPSNKEKADSYLKHVSEYTNLLKLELLADLGYMQIETKDGYEYVPVDASSTEKLAEKIRQELERDDTVGDHLIDFIDVNADGTLKYDLSLHPEANKIEKLILSLINKRIIKQKVNGEPFVMVSGAMYEGVFDGSKLKQATDEEKKKYIGSNFLPTYYRKEDGTTAAMKVMVAFQGDFTKLVRVKDKNGKSIGVYDEEKYTDAEGNAKTRRVLNEEATLKKLNELIKDDEWLNMDNGANREAITMVGVRIPVQGLNSMEFMEVYHFLPSTAGNLIIPPAEIVAKSGGDFDIDKMTVFMPNLDGKGRLLKREYSSNEDIKKAYYEAKESGESVENFFENQKKAIQNELIKDLKDILSIKENYASLVRPNGTYLIKPIADDLAQYVMAYDPYGNELSVESNYKVKDPSEKTISPTRVLEVGYNLYKHESNVIGKKTLGLGAIENTFNILFNSLGAKMPQYYMQKFFDGTTELRESRMFLKHNIMKVKDENGKDQDHISLSHKFDADNINKISDIYSQAINGWVDVEKDAWIFFIQGNYEVAPVLLYLIKAGVPAKEAIFFVSQPLVLEYVKEQRLAKSTFSDTIGKKPAQPQFAKAQASKEVIKKYFGKEIKQKQRYKAGSTLADELFTDRKSKEFSQDEMYKLIKDSSFNAKQIFNKFYDENNREPNDAEYNALLKEAKAKSDAAKSTLLSQTMFMHFLELEQQMDGVKRLKFASNPDTKLRTTLGSIEEAEANLEGLTVESKLDQELLQKMLNDSVTSSFFNGDLGLALSRPLFPLAYHPAISNFIITNMKDFEDANKTTFNNKDKMVTTFRNDLLMMLFQNAVRKYAISESYQGYDVSTSIPVEIVKKLNFGAYVKENKAGVPTLYMDKKQLENDFKSKAWMKNTTAKNSYASRGLYPLEPTYFSTNKKVGQTEYFKFVAEREYLRSIYPIAEVESYPNYTDEIEITKGEFPELPSEKQVRLTYERILAERALENTFNPQQLFKTKRSAFALQFSSIMKNHPELANKYAVLQKMKVDYSADKTRFQLYINENKYNNSTSNLYYKNLKDLADPTVRKVANQTENKRISDFFAKVPMVAFYQAGLNKSKLNFVNVINYDSVVDMLNQEIKKMEGILNADNANVFLRAYFDQFVNQNDFSNRERRYFKDYFLSDNLSDIQRTREDDGQRYGVSETINPQVFVYSNLQAQRSHYEKILEMNPDITLMYNMTIKEVNNPNVQFGGQNIIRELSPGAIGLPTSQDTVKDNFSKLAVKDYSKVISAWELMLSEAKKRIDNGENIGLSREGYGDPSIMPQELFVYLSKRLYEEFQYINPGSTQFKDVMDTINSMQDITDEEILQIFDEENDPFKCKI
jgi:hypothetical protein